jgi:hypothetical protein
LVGQSVKFAERVKSHQCHGFSSVAVFAVQSSGSGGCPIAPAALRNPLCQHCVDSACAQRVEIVGSNLLLQHDLSIRTRRYPKLAGRDLPPLWTGRLCRRRRNVLSDGCLPAGHFHCSAVTFASPLCFGHSQKGAGIFDLFTRRGRKLP